MTIYHRKSYGDFEDGFYRDDGIDLNDLNCFRELTHLEIYSEYGHVKGKLNLPKLQIAAFEAGSDTSGLELDCPKLKALKIRYSYRVTLTSATDQLEYLHYDQVSTYYLKDIRLNLLKLSTIVFENGDFLLQFLSDLQTGSLHAPLLSEIRLENCGHLGPLDELASSLEDLKNDPRTKCITFTLMGRPIHSPKNELRPIAELKRVYEVENFDSHMAYLREAFEKLHIDMNALNEEEFNRYMRDNQLSVLHLEDHSFLFLKRHPELQFLFESTRVVRLEKDIELDEEIKKLKNVTRLEFCRLFRPSDSLTELVIENCKLLQSWLMYHQTVTERLLEIMSEELLNLEYIRIYYCRHETLKPLATFRNLQYLTLDFDPQRDEVQFLFENSRTLEIIDFPCQKSERENGEGRFVQLLRRTQKPKVLRLTISTKTYPRPGRSFEFDTLSEMIENYANDFEQLENYETTRM